MWKNRSLFRRMPAAGVFHPIPAILVAFTSALLLNGCNRIHSAPQSPPPPPVTVAQPLWEEVIEWDTYHGYLEAKESVNVSARVSGLIMEAPFVEGSFVKKSQVLFLLDERPFKADLDSKLADVEKAKATVALTQRNYRRAEDIYKRGASSMQDHDVAKADYDSALATLASANAAVATARLNLEWCQVISPIDGRVGRKIVTPGNLITGGPAQSQPTLLTTIQSVNPIYCNIDVDEQSVQKYQRLAANKQRVHERDGKVPCYVRLGSEVGFPRVGFIDFVDNRLDIATGTQRMRGLIPNEDGILTPGFYASLRIPGSGKYKTLLVPDSAIGSDQNHRTVLVINQDNIVEVRIVEVGALFCDFRAITSGLSQKDKVIINGKMKAFPGTPVTPTETTLQFDLSCIANPGLSASRQKPSKAAVPPTSETTP